jgi:hypothetical protein
MLRDSEEEVIGHLAAVVEQGDTSCWVESSHAVLGDELDVTLGKGGHERARRIR